MPGDEDKGLSFRQLMIAFLAVVALAAVFFSLGFFVGYKERTLPNVATETVPPPADAPPVVAPPAVESSASPTTATEAPSGATATSPVDESNLPASQSTPPSSAPVSTPVSVPPARSSPSSSAQSSAAPAAPKAKPIKGITVQVAALSTEQDAQSLIGVLKSRGYRALLMTPQQAGVNDSFFRVVVGPFTSLAAAEAAKNKLAEDGFKPFVRK